MLRDPAAVTARYRIHFEHALARPADYEKLMAAMSAGFASQGKEPAALLHPLEVTSTVVVERSRSSEHSREDAPARNAARIRSCVLSVRSGGVFPYLFCASERRQE